MFGSGEMIVVIAVVVMLFGSSQIPKLAKNLGLAQKELKDATGGSDDAAAAAAKTLPAPAPNSTPATSPETPRPPNTP